MDFGTRLMTFSSRHPEPRSSYRRRSSVIDFPQLTGRRSSLAFRKSDQVNYDNTRRMSLLESKANGDVGKNIKNLVVKVRPHHLIERMALLPFNLLV